MTYDEAIEQVRNCKAVHRPEWPPELIIVLENTGPRGEKSPVRYYLDNTAGFPSGSYFPFSPDAG